MKKKPKKLVLNRETLRTLEEVRLRDVNGASDGSDGLQCAASRCLNASCNSCNTCGSKYC